MSDRCAEFRHQIYGGSARNFLAVQKGHRDVLDVVNETMMLLFRDIYEDYREEFEVVARYVSVNLTQKSASDGVNTVNSMMLHLLPVNKKIWASKFMALLAAAIVDKRTTAVLDELRKIIGSSGAGFLFEATGHRKLLLSTAMYSLKPLFASMPENEPEFGSVLFNLRVFRFKTVSEIANLPNGTYGLPMTANFAVVDAIVQPDTLIQFTTSPKKHEGSLLQLPAIRSHLRAGAEEHRMIFVIPQENIETFRFHADLGDIRQYVCLADPSVLGKTSLMNAKERKAWVK
jgi:hypothetical protein